MNNSENLEEMVAELTEDLQLQADMMLTDHEQNLLNQNGFLFTTSDRIAPFLSKIRQYLQMTPINERIWTLCRVQDISTSTIYNYVFLIKD